MDLLWAALVAVVFTGGLLLFSAGILLAIVKITDKIDARRERPRWARDGGNGSTPLDEED